MHLNRLRTFVRVVDSASFSGAARTLGISQSAVSQQMKALEEGLGATLLVRGAADIVPTESGKLVYEQAGRMLRLWEELLAQLQDAEAAEAAKLLIGSSTVPSAHVLGDVMYRFRQHNPEVEVSVQIGDSTDVWDWVRDDAVDIGVVGMLRTETGIGHRPLAHDTIVLIAPCSHPWRGRTVSTGELQDAPIVWRESGSGTREAVNAALHRWGLDPERMPRAAELSTTEAVVSAVEAGLGLSFVSSLAVRSALSLSRICTIELDAPPIERQFHLIYKASRIDERPINLFVQRATKSGNERS